jgi:excisionase family DNA binding protein
LVALHGERNPLLRVADVAERLEVCAATVYRLCESGQLPHVRIVNSIRVRPDDLSAFVAGVLFTEGERETTPEAVAILCVPKGAARQ